MTKNIKKAYRLWASHETDLKKSFAKKLELAEMFDIPTPSVERLNDPRNWNMLRRSNFWGKLSQQISAAMEYHFAEVLNKSEHLRVGMVCETLEGAVITGFHFPTMTVQYPNGRKVGSHKPVYYFRHLAVHLPGEDPDGEEFWKAFQE